MGEGISKSIVQGNNNLSNQNDQSIYESEAEEQQVDHTPVSNNTGPTGEVMTTSYGRVSHAPI